MKIIPMITYIVLENCTSQILCILYVNKSYFSTPVQCAENIKYREDGEIEMFLQNILIKGKFPHHGCFMIHLSSETS